MAGVSRVFSAAAALDGPSREAYLDEACLHDPKLRAAVDSLLGAHDAAGSFGETPLVPLLGTARRLVPGSQLGPFLIETWLGAGGMGEVYRGYDTKLQRAVAIKVLPDFFAEDANRLARFEEEARALAALNHPHVGAIYGLEESAGVVALVLELVRPSLKVDVPKQLFNFRRPASLLEVSSDGRFLLFVPHVRAGERPIVVDMAAITSTQR